MEKDLISGFDIKEIDKKIATRNLKAALVLFIFSIVYFLLQLQYLYGIIIKANDSKLTPNHFLYTYRIYPAIFFIEIVGYAISSNYYYKAWKNQIKAIEEENSLLFNKGLHYFSNGLLFSIVLYLISFIRIYFRLKYYP